jgi:hypothetical protein
MQTLQADLTKPEVWTLLNELPNVDNSLLVILATGITYFIVENRLTEQLLLSTNKCIKVYLDQEDWQHALSGKDYSIIGNLDLSPLHFADFLSL